MLIRDIIKESRMGELDADLTSLLMSVRANDITDVETSKIVQQLQTMGYSIGEESLTDLLQGHPLIQSASYDTISFKHNEKYAVSGDAESKEQNKEKVNSLAKKAAAKGIKQ